MVCLSPSIEVRSGHITVRTNHARVIDHRSSSPDVCWQTTVWLRTLPGDVREEWCAPAYPLSVSFCHHCENHFGDQDDTVET